MHVLHSCTYKRTYYKETYHGGPMKLIGSLIESRFRKELAASSLEWRNQPRIIRLLEEHVTRVDSMFGLSWVPGQLEGLHTILVNGQHVAYLEIPKFSGHPQVTSMESVATYARHLRSLHKRIQLSVALELDAGQLGRPEDLDSPHRGTGV